MVLHANLHRINQYYDPQTQHQVPAHQYQQMEQRSRQTPILRRITGSPFPPKNNNGFCYDLRIRRHTFPEMLNGRLPLQIEKIRIG